MMLKYVCSNCGKEIAEDTEVCPHCKTEFEELTKKDINDAIENGTTYDNNYTTENGTTYINYNFDKQVTNTVQGLLSWATITKILFYIGAVIFFIIGIGLVTEVDDENAKNAIVATYIFLYPILFIIAGKIWYLIISWLSHTLECLHILTKKK